MSLFTLESGRITTDFTGSWSNGHAKRYRHYGSFHTNSESSLQVAIVDRAVAFMIHMSSRSLGGIHRMTKIKELLEVHYPSVS
jgi:hypothetical protein